MWGGERRTYPRKTPRARRRSGILRGEKKGKKRGAWILEAEEVAGEVEERLQFFPTPSFMAAA